MRCPARGVAYSRASREELRVSKGPKAGLRILQDACVFWNMITHTHTISFRLEFDSSCRMPDVSCTEPPIDGRIRQMAEGEGRPFCICTARGLPKCGTRYRDAVSHGTRSNTETHTHISLSLSIYIYINIHIYIYILIYIYIYIYIYI